MSSSEQKLRKKNNLPTLIEQFRSNVGLHKPSPPKHYRLLASEISLGTKQFFAEGCKIQRNKVLIKIKHMIRIKIIIKSSALKNSVFFIVIRVLQSYNRTKYQKFTIHLFISAFQCRPVKESVIIMHSTSLVKLCFRNSQK